MNQSKLTFKNIRFLDILIFSFSFIVYAKMIFESILRYQKTYKNSFSVMYKMFKNRYPFEVTLKNGVQHKIENYWQAYLEVNNSNYTCKIDQGVFYLKNKTHSQEIKLIDGAKGDVNGVFFQESYQNLPIKNQVVIDIGANIGDSSIYFALKGASKIIAVEPFPKNYDLAKRNIELNNFQEQIQIIHAGCSSKRGKITIDSEKDGAWAELTTSNKGKEIKLITLGDIIQSYNIESAILKMDCEGCEYDVVKNSSKLDFEKINYCIIEYHYGYLDLKMKLESFGFDVKIIHPRFIYNFQLKKKMAIGMIFATKNKKIK